jgi:hypothetical protein
MSEKAFPGDTVSFTAGAERYALNEGDITVGPITVTTTLGPGEEHSEAFIRAHVMAQTMFDLEFKTKVVAFKKRAAEAVKL